MYENDYSWVPSFFAGLMAVAALGGMMIALIRSRATRLCVLWVWLSIPVVLSMVLGVSALFAENVEPLTPILLVPFVAALLLPPWAIATFPAFAVCRYVFAKVSGLLLASASADFPAKS